MGVVTKAMENNKTTIRRGRPNIHRDQAIVERFNRTLAERLFGYQYAVEMNMPSGRSTAWVKRLPEVVAALNNTVTRLIGKKPADAIREKAVASKPATPYMRPVGVNERKLPPQAYVRYLYYLSRLVVDGAVDSGQLKTVVEVPLQERGIQEHLFRRQNPQKLLLVREALSTTVLQIVVHVLRHHVVGHTAVDEKGRKLLKLRPQLLRDFDVHLCEAEPLLAG